MSIVKRAAAIALGLALGAALLESGLRLASREARSKAADGLIRGPAAAPERILCLGESTTAPVFQDGKDFSWPAQLESLLAQAQPGRFQVINAGVVGTVTPAILARLPELLARYRPSIVVAMVGVNDPAWYGVPAAGGPQPHECRLCRAAEYLSNELPLAARLLRLRLSGGRAFRLPPSVAQCYAFAFPSVERSLMLLGDPARDLAVCRRAAQDFPDYHETYDAMAVLLFQGFGDRDAAMALADEAVARGSQELSSLTLHAYHQAFLGRSRQAEEAFRGAVSLHPDQERAYGHLIAQLAQDGELGQAREAFQRMLALDGVGAAAPAEPRAVDRKRPDGIERVTAAATRALVLQARSRGARVIAMQYPLEDARKLRVRLRGIAGVAFVDNRPAFAAALKKAAYDRYFSDRFAGAWGHCTPSGNALIARDAFAAVEAVGAARNKPH